MSNNWHSVKDGKKLCHKCGEWLSLDNFYIRTKGKGCKLVSTCKECTRQVSRDFRKFQRDKYLFIKRKAMLKKEYGLSLEDFNTLYESQGGKCAICGIPEIQITFGKDKRLFIDHNHNSKKIRGLLCHNCNMGIGHLKEDINLLEKSIKYLKERD